MAWLSRQKKLLILLDYRQGQQLKAQWGLKGIARKHGVHYRTVQKIVARQGSQAGSGFETPAAAGKRAPPLLTPHLKG